MVAVYAMLARSDDTARHLSIDDQGIVSWLYAEPTGAPPLQVGAFWQDGGERTTEFPSYSQRYPILSVRVADAVQDSFDASAFIPVDVRGEGVGAYELCMPLEVVDCLDSERSSGSVGLLEVIERVVFVPSKVRVDLPAFRIPESRGFVFWNEWAAKRVVEAVGEDDIEVRLVWSDVPDAVPHPDPMNI